MQQPPSSAPPPPPPALAQQLHHLFDNASVAYTTVVSLRDQCIIYRESAQNFFSGGTTRTDGSTSSPAPPSPSVVDRWLAAVCGAASPFLEASTPHDWESSNTDAAPSPDEDRVGWTSATFSSREWDIIAYRCTNDDDDAQQQHHAAGVGGIGGSEPLLQPNQLLMVTFRRRGY